jgi:MATE family multidrug resistance protein
MAGPPAAAHAVAPQSVASHVRRLLALAVPATTAQLGSMMLMVVDVAMLGRVSVAALDAAALGRVWVWGTMVFGMGLVFGIDPIASQAFGAGDRARLDRSFGTGVAMALLSSVPIGLAWLLCAPALGLLGQEPALAREAQRFVIAQLPGLPFLLVFLVAKQYQQAQGIVLPAMWITLAGNAVNVFLNWLLIFGHWGLPPLGVTGAGIATSLTHAALTLALLLWMRHRGGPASWRAAWASGRRAPALREAGRLGLPVAAHLAFEVWAFQLATLLAGRLGPVELAAHTAALTVCSVTFMVPLGVSLAAAVRVGNLLGARQRREAQRAAWVALAAGGGFMALSGLTFLLARWQLPRLFSADLAVVAATAAILPVAAAFQVFDGLQVVGAGVLRGMGQTRPAAVFNLFGYYVLALPLAWWLGVRLELGLLGIWWGLALGLATVALLLVGWVAKHGPASGWGLASEAPAKGSVAGEKSVAPKGPGAGAGGEG